MVVKLDRVGKPRPFLRGLVLTIVTVGLYGAYWLYRAPHELYEQFGLKEEGRDDGVVWLVVGLVVTPLLFVYFWKAVENVRYLRRRLGLTPGVSPGAFIALQLVVPLVAFVLALALLATTSADAGTQSADDPVTVALALVVLLLVVVGFVLMAQAYRLFQESINEVWTGWGRRAAELKGRRHPAPGAAAPDAYPERAVHRPDV